MWSTMAKDEPARWKANNNLQEKSSKARTKEQEHGGSFMRSTEVEEEPARWREATTSKKGVQRPMYGEGFAQNTEAEEWEHQG